MGFRFVFAWWRRRAITRLNHLHVTLYTRRSCHLCERAWHFLQVEQRRYQFRIETVDVDTDAELQVLYGSWVPVVAVDGKIRFRGAVNPVLLARFFRAEASRQSPASGDQGEGAPDP